MMDPAGRDLLVFLRFGGMRIVCYISGHGLGHAVRVTEVLRALRRRRPDLAIILRTPLAPWIFELPLGARFQHGACRLDVGAVQRDGISVDPEASLQAYAEIAARRRSLVAAELAAIGTLRPDLLLGDIPALAFDVAAGLGIPGVAMTNFSWDWIYADYVRDFPAYADLVEDLKVSYGRASALLRLPFHGDLSAFSKIRDIPLVARQAVLSRREVCRRLGLPSEDRLVLLSFGGIGLDLDVPPPDLPGVTFVSTRTKGARSSVPPTCRVLSGESMRSLGILYEDLVGACDVVLTKPGYGIVADCMANATPMVYTSRGRFAEYDCLVKGIKEHLPSAFITNEDLLSGRWRPALESVFAEPRRAPGLALNGAVVAAEALLEWLGSQTGEDP